MEFTERQKLIMKLVKEFEPITGDQIAQKLGFSKPTLRSDLSLLTMTGMLYARPKVGYIYSGQSVQPLLFDQLFEKQVADIMVPAVFTKPETSLKDAITDLFMYDIGSLYVVNDQTKLVGILSRKDLLRATVTNHDASMAVALVMTRMPNLITITKDCTILEAGQLLMEHQIDSLPVVEHGTSDHVIGKLTKTKLMNYFIQEGINIKHDS